MPGMEENYISFPLTTLQLGMVCPGCYQLFVGESWAFCACWYLPVPKL